MFGRLHASFYDRWHGGKDYAAEVHQLSEVFAKEGPIRTVLDLGCGTGRHLGLLVEAGHEVTGIDRSPSMVDEAARRLAGYGEKARVFQGDLLDLELGRTFDAVIMMYSVFGYLVSNDALLRALAVVHRHLRPGGLFLFDFFDGLVVQQDPPGGGFGTVIEDNRQLVRANSTELRPEEQVIEYRFGMWLWDLADGKVLDHAEETHPIRYFLPRELDLMLQVGGFEPLGSAPLRDARDWTRLLWARKLS